MKKTPIATTIERMIYGSRFSIEGDGIAIKGDRIFIESCDV